MGRKYPKLIIDGYEFQYEKKTANTSTTFWVCGTYHKSKCKGRLITKGNVVYLRHSHNHPARDFDLSTMSSKRVEVIREKLLPAVTFDGVAYS